MGDRMGWDCACFKPEKMLAIGLGMEKEEQLGWG